MTIHILFVPAVCLSTGLLFLPLPRTTSLRFSLDVRTAEFVIGNEMFFSITECGRKPVQHITAWSTLQGAAIPRTLSPRYHVTSTRFFGRTIKGFEERVAAESKTQEEQQGLPQLNQAELSPGQQTSRSYLVLFAIYATLAVCTCTLPSESADLLFGSRPGGQAESVCTLMRLLATGFASAGFVTLTLQRALEDKPISQRKFERLNLGLSVFATLNILLLTTSLVSPKGSIHFPLRPGFWASAVTYFLTISVGWGRYARKGALRQTVKDTIPGLPAIKQDVEAVIKNSLNNYFPNSYTVITLSLVTWGLAQFFVPWEMVDLLISNTGGPETELMGRLLSCGMVSLLPAMSYSLKEVARDEAIKQSPSKTLNAGLAAGALINVAVLLPYVTQNRGGALLAGYLALWAAIFVTSGRNVLLPSEQKRTPQA